METDLGDPYEQLLIILAGFQPVILLLILFILILLVFSALISGSEIAFFSLGPNDVRSLQDEESTSSKKILALKAKPRRLLATILISNNFINIAIVLLFNKLNKQIFPPEWLNGVASELYAFFNSMFNVSPGIQVIGGTIQFLITVIGVTFILVLFGEITPKIYANVNNIKLAKFMSRPLMILNTLFTPVTKSLVKWSIRMEKRLIKDRSNSIRENIDHAIELTVRQDENSEEEVDILKSIVKFSDVTVKQIMCSRMDVVAVDETTPFPELMKIVKDKGFSRIPVYKDDFDNVQGILYVKDLLGHLSETEFDWQKLIHSEVLYTPESRKINELLKDFQTRRMHMAIVVDEFGGSAGVVTLEDVMEEVIGDIKDEFDDREEIDYIKIDDHNFIFEGKTMINDVSRITGLSIDSFEKIRGDADSLAGIVLENIGYLPKVNRIVKINDITFKILAVNKRRIERIQLTHDIKG